MKAPPGGKMLNMWNYETEYQSILDPPGDVVQKIILVSQPLPNYTLSLIIVAWASIQMLRVLKFPTVQLI